MIERRAMRTRILLLALVLASASCSGNSNQAVSDSVNTGSASAPIDGIGPLTVGDWTDLTVKAVALCYPNDFWVIEVSGVAAKKEGQSLDRYIEGLVGSKGVIYRLYRYYDDNPGPYCTGEGPPRPGDSFGTPDVIMGSRQTAWVWFKDIRDVIESSETDQLVLVMTDNGYSSGTRFFIKPSIFDARVQK